jgi:hypothetical protein
MVYRVDFLLKCKGYHGSHQPHERGMRVSRVYHIHLCVSSLHPKKSSGYDLITGRILQALPLVGIQFLTQLLNAALILGYFPT